MRILLAGYGYVGQEVGKLFPDAAIYDPAKGYPLPAGRFDFCFVNVPTPAAENGSCDISAVKHVIKRAEADLFVIRSTIPPGTTDALSWNDGGPGKQVVFQPEYVASSSPYPAPLADIKARTFHVLGGSQEAVKKVRRLYETLYPPTTRYIEMSALEAEMTKYMENYFIAAYVTFCNEFYDICQVFGADYDKVREGFLADPRMTPWWTHVYPDRRGWGGHCLPKDTAAIVHAAKQAGYAPDFLEEVIRSNERHKKRQSGA